MDRMHQRDAVQGLCQDTPEVCIPGVHMHQIGVNLLAEGLEVGFEGVECAAELLVDVGKTALAERETPDPHTLSDGILITKGADLDMHQLGEFARQILDVNTGSAVDVGRVLSRQKQYFHCGTFYAVVVRWTRWRRIVGSPCHCIGKAGDRPREHPGLPSSVATGTAKRGRIARYC